MQPVFLLCKVQLFNFAFKIIECRFIIPNGFESVLGKKYDTHLKINDYAQSYLNEISRR